MSYSRLTQFSPVKGTELYKQIEYEAEQIGPTFLLYKTCNVPVKGTNPKFLEDFPMLQF